MRKFDRKTNVVFFPMFPMLLLRKRLLGLFRLLLWAVSRMLFTSETVESAEVCANLCGLSIVSCVFTSQWSRTLWHQSRTGHDGFRSADVKERQDSLPTAHWSEREMVKRKLALMWGTHPWRWGKGPLCPHNVGKCRILIYQEENYIKKLVCLQCNGGYGLASQNWSHYKSLRSW